MPCSTANLESSIAFLIKTSSCISHLLSSSFIPNSILTPEDSKYHLHLYNRNLNFLFLSTPSNVSRETFSHIIEIETESPYPTKAPRLVIFTFRPHNPEIKISSSPGDLLIFRCFCLRQAVPERATIRDPQGRVLRSGTYKPRKQKPENRTLPVGRRIFILSVILNIRSKFFSFYNEVSNTFCLQ